MPLKLATMRPDYEAQLYNAHGYLFSVPTAGQTVTIPNDVSMVNLRPAGTLATLTVAMPVAPVDGQAVRIFSTQVITALTLTVSTGQTMNDAVTTIGAMSGAAYLFSGISNLWNRIL